MRASAAKHKNIITGKPAGSIERLPPRPSIEPVPNRRAKAQMRQMPLSLLMDPFQKPFPLGFLVETVLGGAGTQPAQEPSPRLWMSSLHGIARNDVGSGRVDPRVLRSVTIVFHSCR
jgi:hypothetical protein